MTIKLSDLIELALDDLALVEKDPAYKVWMTTYHSPEHYGDSRCYVCLAGAVMAKTLKASPKEQLKPDNFKEEDAKALRALDCLRVGQVGMAFYVMGKTYTTRHPAPRYITPYHFAPKKFRREMLQLAHELRASGE